MFSQQDNLTIGINEEFKYFAKKLSLLSVATSGPNTLGMAAASSSITTLSKAKSLASCSGGIVMLR